MININYMHYVVYQSYTSIHAMPSSFRPVEDLDVKAANDVPVQVIFNVCPQTKIIISSSSYNIIIVLLSYYQSTI